MIVWFVLQKTHIKVHEAQGYLYVTYPILIGGPGLGFNSRKMARNSYKILVGTMAQLSTTIKLHIKYG